MSAPLLKTKLFVPKPSPGIVSRARLIEKLNAGLDQNLILVLAPAGFGKSTVLSEWAELGTMDTAWLSIDEADNDPKRFFSYLTLAAQQINTSFGKDVLPVLQASDSPPIDHLLTYLINDLAEHDGDAALVLDDYHLIENELIHEGVQFLIEFTPPNLHLMIASRVTPPLPLARMRARNEVTEIRSQDLRFNLDETRTYLIDQMGLDLSLEDIQALHERTEGWITGLHLAALSMQNRDDKHNFITRFSGSHQYIIDYLVGEVLSRQPAEIQTFLLRTSILDRFNASLSGAVVETANAKKLIQRIRSTQLFLIPLDDQGHWYRYHHLFTDFLYQRLTEKESQTIPELHQRASSWFETNDFIPDAIHHSIQGKQHTRAAQLIERIGPEMMMQNRFDELTRWLRSMPEDVVHRWPWLCIIWAWMYERWGQFDAGEEYLRKAEAELEVEGAAYTEEKARIVRGQIAAIRALYALKRGEIELSIRYSNQALEFMPPGLFNRGVALFSLGWAKLDLGDLSGALEAWQEGYETSLKANNRLLAQVIVMGTGNIYYLQSRLRAAAEKYREAIEYRYENSRVRIPYASTAHINLARILLEWNMPDEALFHLHEGLELGVTSKIVDAVILGHAAKVEVHLARRDQESAKIACDEAESMLKEIPNIEPVTITRALSSRVRCLLHEGETAEALKTIQENGLNVEDDIDYFSEFRPMILARALMHSGRERSSSQAIADAHTVLQKILDKAKPAGFTHHQIMALILEAVAFQTEEKHEQALASLAEAVELAEPGGYMRVFLDEGEGMRLLLRQVDLHGNSAKYVKQLLEAFDSDPEHGKDSPYQELLEPLSKRELEVLRLLQSEMTGPEIAAELVISLNTLRTHTKHIYAKLEVNNRRAAVYKAREISLI